MLYLLFYVFNAASPRHFLRCGPVSWCVGNPPDVFERVLYIQISYFLAMP